jgi:hypothetical protein
MRSIGAKAPNQQLQRTAHGVACAPSPLCACGAYHTSARGAELRR